MEQAIEQQIKGANWEADKIGFEQHMLEEDSVRPDWLSGSFGKETMRCEACGDTKCGIKRTGATWISALAY